MKKICWLILILICACSPVATVVEPSSPTVVSPTAEPSSTLEEDAWKTLAPVGSEPLTLTIIYDNYAFDDSLQTAWGFSALVEYKGHTLLFDTGGDGEILMRNMELLGIVAKDIEIIVISHAHADHTAGLTRILELGTRPTLFLPPAFADDYRDAAASVVEVEPGQRISEAIYTTGQMGDIPEQALIIRTAQGLVIMTGCAHPGIVSMIERAVMLMNEPVHLVLGGFHLADTGRGMVNRILAEFRRLGVEKVGPSHCTGDMAIGMFKDEYGSDFMLIGVGQVVVIAP